MKRVTIFVIFALLVFAPGVSGQNLSDPSDPIVPEGHILANPRAGVNALVPSSNVKSGGITTNAVVYSNIGGGDAYLTYVGWPVNDVYGHGITFLNNWVPETGVTIVARVARFTVAGDTITTNVGVTNNNASGGDRVHHQRGPLKASCGDVSGVDTDHNIQKQGRYSWQQTDSDFWIFCQ